MKTRHKKIGIITICDYANFGNRLQNYAVQTILSQYGNVETIEYDLVMKSKQSLKHICGCCYRKIIRSIKKIKKYLFDHKGFINQKKKAITFKNFNRNIIFCQVNNKMLESELNNKYDYFAVGSDQVWNPYFVNKKIMFLSFADSRKKIAVAPSIGITELTSEQINDFKVGLKDFQKLSCREESGSEIIRSITRRECTTLIDPTLMLSKEQWNRVARKPAFHNDDKYILIYFLGTITDEYQQIIKNISDKYSLKIINIYDKKSDYYVCGPSEFVYLVSHCTIMLTDSFHGCVFSYIYDKPFRIFERQTLNIKSMNTRLVNLIKVLHLGDLFIDRSTSIDNILDVNYNKSYLEYEQKKFNDYLNECFD